jgi:hypothetical protein
MKSLYEASSDRNGASGGSGTAASQAGVVRNRYPHANEEVFNRAIVEISTPTNTCWNN